MSVQAQRASELLDVDEVEMLGRALSEWGGPAHASDDLARAMGFADELSLLSGCTELKAALCEDRPITSADWARALVASEIVFVSDLFGAGTEWHVTTGRRDIDTISLLRSIQRKLSSVIGPTMVGSSV